MKKSIFALIIAAVFISGTIVGTIPFATAVGTGGNPDRPIINQLNKIAKLLQTADNRLEKVLGHVGPPEQPLDPPTLDALNKIKSTAQGIVTRVDEKLPSPPPSDTGTPP